MLYVRREGEKLNIVGDKEAKLHFVRVLRNTSLDSTLASKHICKLASIVSKESDIKTTTIRLRDIDMTLSAIFNKHIPKSFKGLTVLVDNNPESSETATTEEFRAFQIANELSTSPLIKDRKKAVLIKFTDTKPNVEAYALFRSEHELEPRIKFKDQDSESLVIVKKTQLRGK